jgi:cytochrome c nitrite reductase small subunit
MRQWFRSSRGKLTLFSIGGMVVGAILAFTALGVLETTDSPEFCSSCHIMDSAFGSFTASNHSTLMCNDCHAPSDSFLTKMTFKARTGMGHVYYNTLGVEKIPDVLHATSNSAEVVDKNCIKCHAPSLQLVDHDSKERCADCHRSVPHGRGMYKPDDWHEPLRIAPPAQVEAAS